MTVIVVKYIILLDICQILDLQGCLPSAELHINELWDIFTQHIRNISVAWHQLRSDYFNSSWLFNSSFTRTVWKPNWNLSLENAPHKFTLTHFRSYFETYDRTLDISALKKNSFNLWNFWCSSKGHRRTSRR